MVEFGAQGFTLQGLGWLPLPKTLAVQRVEDSPLIQSKALTSLSQVPEASFGHIDGAFCRAFSRWLAEACMQTLFRESSVGRLLGILAGSV